MKFVCKTDSRRSQAQLFDVLRPTEPHHNEGYVSSDALAVGIMHRPSKDISPTECHPVIRRQLTHQIERPATLVPLPHYMNS
jgi:hypothetical protein